MNNHYHLLLETPRGNLAEILHHLNGAYTTYFNVKRSRSGHLFQGRYRAILVEMESYCQGLSRYIHLNPVRATLVKAPEDHSWSSYCAYIGLQKKPSWMETSLILGYFSSEKAIAHQKYRSFTEEAMAGPTPNPLQDVYASTFLGSQDFIERVWKRRKGQSIRDERNIPALKVMAERPPLGAIKEAVDKMFGSSDRHSRKCGVYISRHKCGFHLKEIGNFYGMKEAAVSQAVRRFGQAIQGTTSLKRKLQKVLIELKLSHVET